MASVITDLTDGIKRLQKLNKDMSELELKEEIFELRQLLLNVKEELLAKQERISELEGQIKKQSMGEKCPICADGYLKVTSVKPHPIFGDLGHQERTLACSDCSHTEKRRHDPSVRS